MLPWQVIQPAAPGVDPHPKDQAALRPRSRRDDSKTTLLAFLLTVPLALLARDNGVAQTAQADTTPESTATRTPARDPGSLALPGGPTADQATAAKLVYGLLSDSRYAYRPLPLDDALSADMYKRYLEMLDGGKQYFTAADIAGFSRYKTQLDDAIKSGQLEPAYAMFAVYRQRMDERVAYRARAAQARHLRPSHGDDRFDYDREDAPWAKDSAELDALWTQSVRNDWLRLKLAGKQPRPTSARRWTSVTPTWARAWPS